MVRIKLEHRKPPDEKLPSEKKIKGRAIFENCIAKPMFPKNSINVLILLTTEKTLV